MTNNAMFSLFPLLQNFFQMKGYDWRPDRDAEEVGMGANNKKGPKEKMGKLE